MTEVKAPGDSYTKAKPFTFKITPTYDAVTMKVTELKAEVSEYDKGRNDIAFGTLDDTAGDNKLNGTEAPAPTPPPVRSPSRRQYQVRRPPADRSQRCDLHLDRWWRGAVHRRGAPHPQA